MGMQWWKWNGMLASGRDGRGLHQTGSLPLAGRTPCTSSNKERTMVQHKNHVSATREAIDQLAYSARPAAHWGPDPRFTPNLPRVRNSIAEFLKSRDPCLLMAIVASFYAQYIRINSTISIYSRYIIGKFAITVANLEAKSIQDALFSGNIKGYYAVIPQTNKKRHKKW